MKKWIPIIAHNSHLRCLCKERDRRAADRNDGRTGHGYIGRINGCQTHGHIGRGDDVSHVRCPRLA